jgi:amino acid adenylation domain-containing protein
MGIIDSLLPDPPDLIGWLAQTAARRRAHTAVQASDATLTYGELDHLSNQLARRLIALGVTRDACVGISMTRGAAELVAMLATLKAGGAYVPLDPTHPPDRLQLVVEDAAPAILICRAGSPFADGRAACPAGATLLIADDLAQIGAGYDVTPPAVSYDPEQLAYVLFTSGSTGRPKGVEIPRRAFANFLRSMAKVPGLAQEDRLLAITTTSFDIAGMELFLPLWVGATVVIADRETMLDLRKLSASLERDAITVLQATPTSWRLWLNAGWRGNDRLRLLCGGEAMSPELAQRLVGCGRELWNMYGPTETTVWSSLDRIEAGADPITIGRPIDATQIYVLDGALNLLPAGTVGEIYIGGAGLARGYRGRADLTAERFIGSPPGIPGDRLYRTGDLGRRLEDGRTQCLGRADDQVKIRGFRIELAEIESRLRQAPGVNDGAVGPRTLANGETILIGYVVLDSTSTPEVKEIRRFLQSKLPEYMVPAAFVVLDALPLNTNRKVDRKALSQRTDEVAAPARSGAPPRDDRERKLVEIWKALLDTDSIGIKDNFFDVGGNSLHAVSMMIEIEKAFGRTLPLSTLLTDPTIEQLGALLAETVEARPSLVALRPGGTGPALFLIHDGIGEIILYRNLAPWLREGYPIYGIQPRGQRGCPMVHTRMPEMLAYYTDEIRRIQPEGPYFLGGLSTGGIIAVEIARRLRRAGQAVGMIALFDTAHVTAREKSLAGRRMQSFSATFSQGDPAQSLPLRAIGILRKATRKVSNLVAYETRRRAEEARDRLKMRLLRYFIGRDRPLPPFVREIPPNLILQKIEKAYVAPAPYAGRAVLFRATQKDARLDGTLVDDRPYIELYEDPLLGWETHVTDLEVLDVPGGHVSLLMEPHVRTLADKIQVHLDAATRQKISPAAK